MKKSRLKGLPDSEIKKRLRDEGWVETRQKGSHVQWFNDKFPHRRVTTLSPKMTPNVKRSVFRQAGWEWVPQDLKLPQDLRNECARVSSENESLRKSLYDALELIRRLEKQFGDQP